MIFTALDIARNFEARDNSRGKIYQAEGHVKDVRIEKDGAQIDALVQGTTRNPYRVSVEIWKKGSRVFMESQCSCPVGFMCKHAAAALYEALAEEIRDHESKRRPAHLLSADGKGTKGIGKRTMAWLSTLQPPIQLPFAEPTESRLIYWLTQSKTFNAFSLHITFGLQHKQRDGLWGAPRRQSYQQLLLMESAPPAFVAAEDLAMIGMATHDSLGAAPMAPLIWLPTDDLEIQSLLIKRLVATGRAFSDERAQIPLQLGPPREGKLDWDLDSDGLQRPFVDLGDPDLVLLSFPSLWYVQPQTGLLGPVQSALPTQDLIRFLMADGIPASEIEPLRQLLPETNAALPLPYKVKTGKGGGATPVPVLSVLPVGPADDKGEAPIAAALMFDYEGSRLHPLDPSAHYKEKRDGEILLQRRDRTAEKKATLRLAECGLIAREETDGRGLFFTAVEGLSPWFWTDFLFDSVPRLREDGFQIKIAPALAKEIVEPDSEDIDAAFTQAGDWWFSLDLGISVGGQRVKLLPLLVAMIRNLRSLDDVDKIAALKKCYVPLPDGRQVALPGDRIQTILKTLVELFDPKALDENGEMRVSLDLAAAFVKIEAITRNRWLGQGHLRRLVERLGSFEGIEQIPQPKGLQAELRPYQRDGYNWLHFLASYNLSGILADDMGLGKTIQALAYLLSLKESKKLSAPCLIVMPTSLIANWQAEAERFAPSLKILTLHGKDRHDDYEKVAKADLVLTTYPLLPRDEEKLREIEWSVVILDEAQAIKNPTAKMTQAACALKAKQRLCLTGTPVENHLGEAWSLFTFLMPGLLGDHKAFTKHYRNPIEKGDDKDRKDLLARRLRPFILRRLKTEVAKELPPKTEIVRRVSLSDDQRDLYEAVRHVMNDKVRDEIAAKGIARSQIVILDALLKLRQTCCDPRLVKLEAARKVKSSAKLEELMEMLPTLIEDGRKILLFSQFTSMLDLIKPELDKAAIPFVELRGTTKDRATPIKKFQGGDVPLFLISLKAGGTGLNLTAADTVIHFDPWWNPSVENQATDRAHRIGQDKPVFVYKLIAEGTVEERILELQSKKSGLAAALFGDAPAAAAKLTPDDLRWLMGE